MGTLSSKVWISSGKLQQMDNCVCYDYDYLFRAVKVTAMICIYKDVLIVLIIQVNRKTCHEYLGNVGMELA